MQRIALPNRQDTSSSARFRRIPIPCPEHLPSCPEPSPLARCLLRGLRPRCSLEAATHVPVRLIATAERLSTLRRFLPARHSLSSYPREYAPEWRLDTSNRRLPPNLYLPKLHPCSRRSNRISDLHPVHSRYPSVHADEPASAGPLALSTSCSLADCVAIFAFDVSVATLVRSPRSLNRARAIR